MTPPLLLVGAAALLVFALVSRRAERGGLTPPMWFLLVGWMVGSGGLDLVRGGSDGEMIHALAELALVLVLFTDASRIDLACLRREESLPLRLLGLGLPLTMLAGAAVALVLLPGFGMLEALLLAALLAPTDAALGQAVVSDERIPARIRQSLNVESGLNDGLALPVVLVLATATGAVDGRLDVGYWLAFAARQVVLGPVVGVAVGGLGGRLVESAIERGTITASFERLSVLGLAGLAYAGAELVGGNGFIAAFVAGLTLGNTARRGCSRLHDFGEAEGQLLTLLVFLVFGAVLVPETTAHWSPSVLAYAVLSLTVIRLVPVALSLAGTGLSAATVAFLGWFGPRGLASILFVLLVVEGDRLAVGTTLQATVVLTVVLSTVLHGVTAYPLAVRYAARVGRDDTMPEHRPTLDLPLRIRPMPARGQTD